MFLNETRKEYTQFEFDKSKALGNPFDQFNDWFEFAKKEALFEPNAITLSTSMNNQPNSRVVLLKAFDENGFVFFSNYNSQKAIELVENPLVSVNVFWPKIERQIKIFGSVAKTSSEESNAYFSTRPRDSQLSAWASNQSEEIEDRAQLDKKLDEFKARFPNEVPRPDHWGGYRITPNYFEFWQGRENRYHDRICYKKAATNWTIFRLNP